MRCKLESNSHCCPPTPSTEEGIQTFYNYVDPLCTLCNNVTDGAGGIANCKDCLKNFPQASGTRCTTCFPNFYGNVDGPNNELCHACPDGPGGIEFCTRCSDSGNGAPICSSCQNDGKDGDLLDHYLNETKKCSLCTELPDVVVQTSRCLFCDQVLDATLRDGGVFAKCLECSDGVTTPSIRGTYISDLFNCDTCPAKHFCNGTDKAECHSNCKNCVGENDNQCFECDFIGDDDAFLQAPVDTGRCLTKCDHGFHRDVTDAGDVASNICKQCTTENCDRCDVDNSIDYFPDRCSQCNATHRLILPTSGNFFDTAPQNHNGQPAGIPFTCFESKCPPSFFPTDAPTGQSDDVNVCMPCHASCEECTPPGTEFDCTTCPGGTFKCECGTGCEGPLGNTSNKCGGRRSGAICTNSCQFPFTPDEVQCIECNLFFHEGQC